MLSLLWEHSRSKANMDCHACLWQAHKDIAEELLCFDPQYFATTNLFKSIAELVLISSHKVGNFC